MQMNSFANAAFAALYIVVIVHAIDTIASVTAAAEETILIPMSILSLFVLSAAVMGFLFVYEPLKLYLDGRKQDAIFFFLKTVASFACFVALFVGALLYTATR
jgi:hypothetical protein